MGYEAPSRIIYLLTILVLQASAGRRSAPEIEPEPTFSEPVSNVTVPLGRTARLSCIVDNLGSYRVAWIRVESKTILTIHKNVITRNYRVTLSHTEPKTFVLQITNVRETDRGGYMCQINTVPMRSQIGYIDIVVPPDIIDRESSSDVLAREGTNVSLVCRARGHPQPTITWRREDGKPVAVGNWQGNGHKPSDLTYEGELLSIVKVSRLHMAAYLCIASNNVQPSVSRRILLQVHFPPMIWIPNQLVGAPIGGEVTLECNTEAYPVSINYWTKEDGEMIVSNDKYSTVVKDKTYKMHMKLTIYNVYSDDFGSYKCYAKNSLGSTEGSIRLYEIHVPVQNAREVSTAKIHDGKVGSWKQAGLPSTSSKRNEVNFGLSDDTLTKEPRLEVLPNMQENAGSRRQKATSICFIIATVIFCHLILVF